MKYVVFGIVTGTKYLGTWEADSPDEAIDKALQSDDNHISVCHYCSRSFDLDDICCQEGIAEEE